MIMAMMIRISMNSLLLILLLQKISASENGTVISLIDAHDGLPNEITNYTTGVGITEGFQKINQSSSNLEKVLSDTKNNSATINTRIPEAPTESTDSSVNPNRISTTNPHIVDSELADLLDIPTEPHDENRPFFPLGVSYEAPGEVDLSVVSSEDRYDTEDVLRGPEKRSRYAVKEFEESYEDSNPPEHFAVVQGKMAVVLAGVFVAICIVGYGTLLSWRRFLENRYGNSQMLVNDDDSQRDDLKYFSI